MQACPAARLHSHAVIIDIVWGLYSILLPKYARSFLEMTLSGKEHMLLLNPYKLFNTDRVFPDVQLASSIGSFETTIDNELDGHSPL